MKMPKYPLFALMLLICFSLIFCPLTEAGKDGSLRLKKYAYIDHQGIGIEAFSLLIPADWNVRGGITWTLDNPGMPAVGHITVSSPDGKEAFDVFPNQAMFWTNNQMLLTMFPVGARYFGAEVRPVVDPLTALTQIVLPRFRRNVSGLRVVSQKNLPELARALAAAPQPGVQTFAQGAKIRVEYGSGGIAIEEEIFAVVEGFSFAFQTMQGMVTNTNWFVDYIFSFKAEKGHLDSKASLFKAMAQSFRVNPQWFNKYNQTVNYLIQAQIKQIHSIGELSRIISRTSNEISDTMMKSYEEGQRVHDRISENFSEYIRGTEHYINPLDGREVELPGNYNHVWANAGGEYILTDNPNYNPNVGSNINWQEIQRK